MGRHYGYVITTETCFGIKLKGVVQIICPIYVRWRQDLCDTTYVTIYIYSIFRESVDHPYVPNAGFYEDVVYEDPTILPCGQASDSGEAEVPVEKENDTKNEETGKSIDSTTMDKMGEVIEQTTTVIEELKLAERGAVDEVNVEDQQLSVEDVDALLDKCLLQALHTTVKDKDLPMPGSTLWYFKFSTSSSQLCAAYWCPSMLTFYIG